MRMAYGLCWKASDSEVNESYEPFYYNTLRKEGRGPEGEEKLE